jgi:RNA binding exosome subunit
LYSPTAEAEEAQGRLRASRQKLSEMETLLNSLQSRKEQESLTTHEITVELERLRKQLHITTEQLQERVEENSQLHQRLQLSSQQAATLQAELTEKQSQLSIAQIHLQQVSNHKFSTYQP